MSGESRIQPHRHPDPSPRRGGVHVDCVSDVRKGPVLVEELQSNETLDRAGMTALEPEPLQSLPLGGER